jgi:hypothetical protein
MSGGWWTGGLSDKEESRWALSVLLFFIVLLMGALIIPQLQSGASLVQWVRTNIPANTDSDGLLVDYAMRICAAPEEGMARYEVYRGSLPVEFVGAATGLYCPGHK